ncbi:hypothetical protein [Pseudomonas sp.]|uniref:hypothetical protein n=1 Tax=Pseudomonas sp. TaxID=306 RepID=UPI002735F8C1|nr:hypothetical protein [Pseudomonas sp.]MDP2746180.1 hypothetical protein [Pseudomonas sp.]
MSNNDYKAAFEALSLDLSAIIALLGFDSYTGVDPVLRRITELLVSVPQNPDPRGVTCTSHPALIALDKQCRDDVARAMGLTPNAERDFAWSYLLDRLKRLVGDAATGGSVGGVDDLLADALRKIMDAHRFNVASMPVTEVHSVCFDALAADAAGVLPGYPAPGSECDARIPHHTADGRKMLVTRVEVIVHAIIQGAVYSWVKEPGKDGGFYAPMMLSFLDFAAAPAQQGATE